MLDKLRKPFMVALDITIVTMSMFLAFMIMSDWNISHMPAYGWFSFIMAAVIVRVVIFTVFNMYNWSFRYASVSEAINTIKAVTVGTLVLITMAFFTEGAIILGRSVFLIDYLICLFFIMVSRFLPRVIIKLSQTYRQGKIRVLIVGAGASGEMVARQMIDTSPKIYQPVGFVDDNRNKHNLRLHGVKVLGCTDNIEDIVRKFEIAEIIIAIPSANGRTIRDIISKCEKTGAKIKTIPGIDRILNGEIAISHIRNVRPEDLMGRETVKIDTKDIIPFLEDKVVLVSGAAGSIGAELCRQIMKFSPKKLILYDYNENDIYFLQLELNEKFPGMKFETIIGDIRDVWLLKWAFSNYRPDIVFHSAAHKHVPLMEENPVAAIKNNVIGTRNLIYAAEYYGVKSFVMISTDKAVNPTSIMGASKRIAEMMIQAKAKKARTKFMAVRFGNVIGSSGSVVPIFKKQIENGGPITVTHPEAKRFFMTASEAAQMVLQAGAMGKGGEIFILDMGDQIRISDLAKNLITLSGLKPEKDIEIKYAGLRLGEKMYDEMLLDIKNDRATKHDKIYIVEPGDFDSNRLRRNIRILEQLAISMDKEKMIEKIKEIVPTYKPNGNGSDGSH